MGPPRRCPENHLLTTVSGSKRRCDTCNVVGIGTWRQCARCEWDLCAACATVAVSRAPATALGPKIYRHVPHAIAIAIAIAIAVLASKLVNMNW